MARPNHVPSLETRIGLHLTSHQRRIAERLSEQYNGNLSEAIRRLIESAAVRPVSDTGASPAAEVLTPDTAKPER
jgi:hypothetical protein